MSKAMRIKGFHDGENHAAGLEVPERAHLSITPAYRVGFQLGMAKQIMRDVYWSKRKKKWWK